MPDAPAPAESGFGSSKPHGAAINVGRRLAAALKSFLKPPAPPSVYVGIPSFARPDSAPIEELPSTAAHVESQGGNIPSRAERQKVRLERLKLRNEKSGQANRATRICTLGKVEVKKNYNGYQVTIKGRAGRRVFSVASHEVGPVLNDLETAIQIIRGRC